MGKFQTEEERLYYERTRRAFIPTPTTPLGKLGCRMALVLWFALLMTPCCLFALAISGEITIAHGTVPDPESHPLIQVNVVMDADNRGFKLTRSAILPDTDQAVCVETHVTYLMWQTDGSATPVVFCDCYERNSAQIPWQLANTVSESCQ